MSDLPHGWEWATLGELAAPGDFAITDGPFGSNLKSSHYTARGPRVIRLQNIGDGWFKDEKAHISQDHFDQLNRHSVEGGDVIVAALGASLPRACMVPDWLGPAIVKADCFRFRLHRDVDPHFVTALLNSPQLRATTSASISGVGRPRLSLHKARSLTIPIAPSAEQHRIADAIEEQFSRLDDAVKLLTRTRLRTSGLRTRLLEESLQFADSDTVPLEDIAEIVGGVTKHSGREHTTDDREVPYLRVANVQRGYLDLGSVATIRVTAEKAESLRLQPGDILFNEGGDRDKLGRGWVWEGQIEDCIHQNHVFRARLDTDSHDPKFVSLHGNSFGRLWFQEAGTQTTNLASLSRRTLARFPVPVLPLAEQKQIVADVERQMSILDALDARIDSALKKADSLRKSILAAAFRGELVPQDPDDEPASSLLVRIAASRITDPSRKRRRRGGREA